MLGKFKDALKDFKTVRTCTARASSARAAVPFLFCNRALPMRFWRRLGSRCLLPLRLVHATRAAAATSAATRHHSTFPASAANRRCPPVLCCQPAAQAAKVAPKDPDLRKKLTECERAVKRIKFEEALGTPVRQPGGA